MQQDNQAQIILVGVGFSRGAAELRDFANMVVSQGVPIIDPTTQQQMIDPNTGAGMFYQGAQAPRFGAELLFDTVGSMGVPGTNLNPGFNLSIPAGVTAPQIVANDEGRLFFPLSSVNGSTDTSQTYNSGGIIQLGLPGAHSDIGGSYSGSYQYFALDIGYNYLSQLGVPLAPLTSSSPSGAYDYNVNNYDPSTMALHNSNMGIDNVLQFLHLESTN